MNATQDRKSGALRMLARKQGATVDELVRQLDLPNPKAARSIIDRLRAEGAPVKNSGKCRFKLPDRRQKSRE